MCSRKDFEFYDQGQIFDRYEEKYGSNTLFCLDNTSNLVFQNNRDFDTFK